MNGSKPYRFGALGDGDFGPYAYPGLWEIQSTTGPDRLVLAPAGGFVDLIGQLVTAMAEPYGLLHVLLVSRRGREPGRYQTRQPMDEATLRSVLRRYAGYLEHDGRHHTWFFGLGDDQQVIYDNHNLIYCYGDLELFTQIAEANGLAPGAVAIPAPHQHQHNQAFDADEDRIFSELEWIHFPLQPDDDP